MFKRRNKNLPSKLPALPDHYRWRMVDGELTLENRRLYLGFLPLWYYVISGPTESARGMVIRVARDDGEEYPELLRAVLSWEEAEAVTASLPVDAIRELKRHRDVSSALSSMRLARCAAGLTISDMSNATGLPAAQIAAMESGKRDPHLSTLVAYLGAVGATFDVRPVARRS